MNRRRNDSPSHEETKKRKTTASGASAHSPEPATVQQVEEEVAVPNVEVARGDIREEAPGDAPMEAPEVSPVVSQEDEAANDTVNVSNGGGGVDGTQNLFNRLNAEKQEAQERFKHEIEIENMVMAEAHKFFSEGAPTTDLVAQAEFSIRKYLKMEMKFARKNAREAKQHAEDMYKALFDKIRRHHIPFDEFKDYIEELDKVHDLWSICKDDKTLHVLKEIAAKYESFSFKIQKLVGNFETIKKKLIETYKPKAGEVQNEVAVEEYREDSPEPDDYDVPSTSEGPRRSARIAARQ